MKQRIITAIIFALIMILGIFGGSWTFAALILFITVMSYVEFFRIAKLETNHLLAIIFGVSPVLFAFKEALPISTSFIRIDYIVLTIGFFFIFYFLELFRASPKALQNLSTIIFSYFYIGMPYALLVAIAWWSHQYEPLIVIGLLLMVWLNDTGAYFSGKFLGKHKLAPKISPKKTWEGLIGGVIAAMITSQILAYFIPNYSHSQWLAMGLISSLGILGDLVESMFKRGADVKDSGNIMPGHGGILDRFDAFAFVVPIIFIYFYFFV